MLFIYVETAPAKRNSSVRLHAATSLVAMDALVLTLECFGRQPLVLRTPANLALILVTAQLGLDLLWAVLR